MGDGVSAWEEALFDDLIDELKKTASGMTNETENLERQLGPLFETWEGDARAAYQTAKGEWDKAEQELRDIIEQLGQAINDVKEGFISTESSNAQLFG